MQQQKQQQHQGTALAKTWSISPTAPARGPEIWGPAIGTRIVMLKLQTRLGRQNDYFERIQPYRHRALPTRRTAHQRNRRVAAGVGLYRVRAVGRAPRAADAGSGHSSPTYRTATQRPAAGLVGMHYGRPTARVTPTGAITRRGLLRSQRKPNRRLPAGPPALGNP